MASPLLFVIDHGGEATMQTTSPLRVGGLVDPRTEQRVRESDPLIIELVAFLVTGWALMGQGPPTRCGGRATSSAHCSLPKDREETRELTAA
jgi:hypothetical protein